RRRPAEQGEGGGRRGGQVGGGSRAGQRGGDLDIPLRGGDPQPRRAVGRDLAGRQSDVGLRTVAEGPLDRRRHVGEAGDEQRLSGGGEGVRAGGGEQRGL